MCEFSCPSAVWSSFISVRSCLGETDFVSFTDALFSTDADLLFFWLRNHGEGGSQVQQHNRNGIVPVFN